MDKFITIYFTNDYEPSENEVAYFEKAIAREIGMGSGFINVYTQDHSLIEDLITLIGDYYISGVA